MAQADVKLESQQLIDEGPKVGLVTDGADGAVPTQVRIRSRKILVGAISVCALLGLALLLGSGLGGQATSEAVADSVELADMGKMQHKVVISQQEKNLKRQCSTKVENCLKTGCCADAGHQCYAKSSTFGMCMKTCDPAEKATNDPLKEAWTCDPIGTRYTPDYRDDYSPDFDKFTLVEPWVKNCSSIGESCLATKCCSWTGYYCYEKDASWASCLSACTPMKENGGETERPKVQIGMPKSNPPPHNNATFTKAPPGPWSCKKLSVPLTPSYLDETSLFCYSYAIDNHGKGQTQDFLLMSYAQKMNTFIFACDHWVVFSDVSVPLSPGNTVVVDYPKQVRRPNTKVWVNLPLFVNMWTKIKEEGTYKNYAWTVKADPYTVFIPQRLRSILAHQPVPPNGAYLENCKHVRMGFHGSLEVASRNAFTTLLDNLDNCQTELPITNGTKTHFKYYGEDKFLIWCMHKHGVGRVPSRQEVITVPANEPIYGLHITVSCPAHKLPQLKDKTKKKWQPDCTKVRTAGIHGFTAVGEYIKCHAATIQF